MSRARTQNYDDRQTAAALEDPLTGTRGSGCLSGFMIPPIAVLLVSCLLAAFAIRQPVLVQARNPVISLTGTAHPTDTASLPEPTPFFMLTPTNTPAIEPVAIFSIVEAGGSASSDLSGIFTPEVQYWRDSIITWATAAGLDPNLAAVVMQIESCGDPRALSRSGAMGLFQVMPFHFYTIDHPYDPNTNAQRGLDYLARALEAGAGNPRLALAGYNGGIGVIARGEWTWSDQTKRYVYYGAPIYEDARAGLSISEMLNEWYTKYGAGLCNQARQRLGLP